MRAEFSINNVIYSVNFDEPADISIPLLFNGLQPNLYNVKNASSKAYEIGNFIGDTRLGGSCNFEEYIIVPHCNGTHTECVGHISFERLSIHKTLSDAFIPAALISVPVTSHADTKETYDPELNPEDFLITAESVNKKLDGCNKDFLKALVIRTLPNDINKRYRRYIDEPYAFFSLEAMELITKSSVEHLLVDIPSVDRAFDEGKMNNHHIFWNVEKGSHETDKVNRSFKTITEMIFVPDSVTDGEYILNLQIAPFDSDAAPSRPVLYKVKK